MKLREKRQYDPLVEQLNNKLNEYEWDAEHVQYVLYEILYAWFHKFVDKRAINDVLGTLEIVKTEFYTKIVTPFHKKR